MENESLIKKLFEGEYDGIGPCMPNDADYRSAYDKTHEHIDYFYNLIPEKDKAKFEDFISDFHLMNKCMNYLWYKEGIKFGLALIKETNE